MSVKKVIPGLIHNVLSLHPSLDGISCLPPLSQPQDALVQPQPLPSCPRHFPLVLTLFLLSLFGIFLHNPVCIHHCSFHYLLDTFRILKRFLLFSKTFLKLFIHLLIPVLFIFFPHRPFVELRIMHKIGFPCTKLFYF